MSKKEKKEVVVIRKPQFVDQYSAKVGCTKEDAGKHYDTFIAIMEDNLESGNKVTFLGFGDFEVVNRAARDGRNPKTKEKIKIPATNSVKFKAGKTLKDVVNGRRKITDDGGTPPASDKPEKSDKKDKKKDKDKKKK